MNTKSERTRNLRYKRPALASMNFYDIQRELDEISEACYEIHWYTDSEDGSDTLLNALDGNEDEVWEFKMAFSDLEASVEQLQGAIWDSGPEEQEFDDCTVALIGNRYNIVGYDDAEEDYFALTSYEKGLAETEAGKRLMRKTKAEMISSIGQCFGILMAYLDLRQSYDYLKATFDILRDENTSLLQTVRDIDALYEEIDGAGYWSDKEKVSRFNKLLDAMPDRLWVE